MPFSLKMSQDFLQMRMGQLTDNLPGTIAIHIEICIFKSILQEHDQNLSKLIKIAEENYLVLNSKKCTIQQSQIDI